MDKHRKEGKEDAQKRNVNGRTIGHYNKKFRTRSMERERGMTFHLRKTATAVKNAGRTGRDIDGRTDRQTDGRTEGRADRWTDRDRRTDEHRQTDTDRQTDRDRQTDGRTGGRTDGRTDGYRQTDGHRQTDRDGRTDRQTDRIDVHNKYVCTNGLACVDLLICWRFIHANQKDAQSRPPCVEDRPMNCAVRQYKID
jgi:hypothetical protein